jgi:hypothetical protein
MSHGGQKMERSVIERLQAKSPEEAIIEQISREFIRRAPNAIALTSQGQLLRKVVKDRQVLWIG